MDIYTAVGKRIREERKKAGLTLEDLAEAASISPSFLAYLERGKKKASLETIKKLADGLQTPIAKLFSSIGIGSAGRDEQAIRKLIPILKERRPGDQELIIDVLKTLAKGLPRRS